MQKNCCAFAILDIFEIVSMDPHSEALCSVAVQLSGLRWIWTQVTKLLTFLVNSYCNLSWTSS